MVRELSTAEAPRSASRSSASNRLLTNQKCCLTRMCISSATPSREKPGPARQWIAFNDSVQPHQARDNRTRMAVRRDAVIGARRHGRGYDSALGQRLRMPTYPQPAPHPVGEQTPMVPRTGSTSRHGSRAVASGIRSETHSNNSFATTRDGGEAHDNHTNQRLDYAGLLWPLGRWNFDFRRRANQSVAANADRPVRG